MSLGSPPNSPPHETTPSGFVHKGLEEHFVKHAALPLTSTPPALLAYECIGRSCTGVVYAAHIGPLALIIKAIPPGYEGESDLRHEAHMYNILASLQGRVLPRMVGFFEGEGWLMLIAEHCGDKVTDISELSLQQR
ncbi:hypothetical protein BDZ89DRAFT_472036 [Hymenopellis radicata]|nr:hypothetical protein BDZ89DRAFT_472036 [Hymenopellis radicata]